MSRDDAAEAQMSDKYKELISRLVNRRISAQEFQSLQFATFKNAENQVLGDKFDILEELFTAADDYVADREVKRPNTCAP